MARSLRMELLTAAVALVLVTGACGTGDKAQSANDSDDARADAPRSRAVPRAHDAKPRRDPAGSQRRNRNSRSGRHQREDKPRLLQLGARGARVTALQRKLESLGYWVGPTDGVFSYLTQQAVFAFQAIEGLTRDGVVGPQTRSAMHRASRPQPQSPKGDLIEVDESRQVLFVVRDGRAEWILHVSTGSNETYLQRNGKPATANTPNGRWKMIYEYKDGWHKSPLGRLWRPKYFHPSGIAIHGFQSVPPYPASHGCVRITIPAMNFFWRAEIAPKGSEVWVY